MDQRRTTQQQFIQCDNHPDKPAIHFVGGDQFIGGGVGFVVSHRLCEECFKRKQQENPAFGIVQRT